MKPTWLAWPPLLLLCACATPAADVDGAPVSRSAQFAAPPAALATCFQTTYASQFPEQLSFERERTDRGVTLRALAYGTANDPILRPRYLWQLEIQAAAGGSSVELRVGPDWIADRSSGPELWRALDACSSK